MERYLLTAAQIIQQNGLDGQNNGLMHDRIGLCIFYYYLAKCRNNQEYEQIADNLLDKVFANINSLISNDFEGGLAGIGWGIEYLVQNGFAEGNTDEILEEIDDKVFKGLHEEVIETFELTNGLTGYFFYLIIRLKNQSNPLSLAQRINRELLILTINKLDEMVTPQFISISKEMYFDLLWRFPVMLYGLVQAFDLNIYNSKIISMVNQWIPYIEAYIPSMHINRIYMATVLSLINVRMPNKRIGKQIEILLFATDFEVLKTEVEPVAFNIRYGWPGFVWLLKLASQIIPENCRNHSKIGSSANEIISKHNYTLENIPLNSPLLNSRQFGLSEGLAGIGLLELLYPNVLTRYDECTKPSCGKQMSQHA